MRISINPNKNPIPKTGKFVGQKLKLIVRAIL
jgi:hypothetical protein